MKFNHEKAQEICQRVDPQNQISKKIIDQMRNVKMLPDFAREMGLNLVTEDFKGENLKNMFVVTAEAIYKGLIENPEVKKTVLKYLEGERSDDDLFDAIFINLTFPLYGYVRDQYELIMGDVESVYDLE